MAGRKNKEAISLTFHYIVRIERDENGDPNDVPITQQEFDDLFNSLDELTQLDYRNDKAVQHDVRVQKKVPIIQVEKFDQRYIAGTHYKSYSGHEIENIDHGKIKKDSISLRHFFFILYLSNDGRIYIGSQALGNYSGYVPLRDTIKSLFVNAKGLHVNSVNSVGYVTKNSVIKEAKLEYSKKSQKSGSGNTYGNKGVVIFKEGDEAFSDQIKTSILPFMDKERKEIKKGISEAVSQNTLVSMDDEDLDECKLIVMNNGRTSTIQLLDRSGWPTHFDTGLEPNSITGHPDYEPLKKVSLEILENEIISSS